MSDHIYNTAPGQAKHIIISAMIPIGNTAMAHHQGLGSGHVLTKLRTCLPIVVVLLLLSLWNNMQHIAPHLPIEVPIFDMTDITPQLYGGDGITYQEMGPNSTIIVNGKKK